MIRKSSNSVTCTVACIKEEIDRKFASLKNLFDPSMDAISAELFTVGIISNDVKNSPSTNTILQSFYSGFTFMNTIEEVQCHCRKFFSALDKMGGPFIIASNSLKQDIIKSIIRNFNFNIFFDS